MRQGAPSATKSRQATHSVSSAVQAAFVMKPLPLCPRFPLDAWPPGILTGASGTGWGRAWSLTKASGQPKSRTLGGVTLGPQFSMKPSSDRTKPSRIVSAVVTFLWQIFFRARNAHGMSEK